MVYKGHIIKDLGQTITNIVAVKTLRGKYEKQYVFATSHNIAFMAGCRPQAHAGNITVNCKFSFTHTV